MKLVRLVELVVAGDVANRPPPLMLELALVLHD